MKTDLEIMKIRAQAYKNIPNFTKHKWWVDMFIFNNRGRSTEELVFGEPPHNRVGGGNV